MEKLKLKYLGRDCNDRPVYKDIESAGFYVDVNPRKYSKAVIFSKSKNKFDGEPDKLIENVEIEFVGKRETLLG